MKKLYCEPSAEWILLETKDILTLSVGGEAPSIDEGPSIDIGDLLKPQPTGEDEE